jgi:hypothetical protein
MDTTTECDVFNSLIAAYFLKANESSFVVNEIFPLGLLPAQSAGWKPSSIPKLFKASLAKFKNPDFFFLGSSHFSLANLTTFGPYFLTTGSTQFQKSNAMKDLSYDLLSLG